VRNKVKNSKSIFARDKRKKKTKASRGRFSLKRFSTMDREIKSRDLENNNYWCIST
jgi:hypothetical protein